MNRHIFERSGLASLTDLKSPGWRGLFEDLEKEQTEFLCKEKEFRSHEYKWPRDSLHTWSRVWEYPYAFYHLRRFQERWAREAKPSALDLGSGVTFFSFAVARLGFDVTCADLDPVCIADLDKAAKVVTTEPGRVLPCQLNGAQLPFADAAFDVSFCISVLEHIPQFESTIAELSRVVKPGGMLILTIDLDLRGDLEIGVSRYQDLIAALTRHFEWRWPQITVHPADLLRSSSGPCGVTRLEWRVAPLLLCKKRIKAFLRKRPFYTTPYDLAVEGMVLQRLS